MNRRLLALSTLMMLMLAPLAVRAAALSAVQGQVIAIHVRTMPAGPVQLRAFGRHWPTMRQADGSVLAWIGVDLARRPGRYPLHWAIGHGAKAWHRTEHLNVGTGSFRISRITVKRKMAEFDAKTLARVLADQRTLRHTYGMAVNASPEIHMDRWPVTGIISTPFGARRYVNGEPRSPHAGIDIAVPKGTPIHAPLAGRVLLVKPLYLDGNTVVLGHGNGLVSVYCHLSHTDVRQGDWVKSGQVIGKVGMTGRATGPHLHWGVHFGNARVDPASLLPPEASSIAVSDLR
jgi:biotin carboxyl carrier protein